VGQFIANHNVTINGVSQTETRISAPAELTGANSVILVNNGAKVSMNNLTIDGKKSGITSLYGVKFDHASGILHNVTVKGITATTLNGAQEFRAIDARATSGNYTLSVTKSTVEDYQKSGIYVSGTGMNAEIENNVITGQGDTPVIAQNGVTIMAGATGKVTNNTISSHNYTTVPNSAFDILFYEANVASKQSNNRNNAGEKSSFNQVTK